jgi:hypothetical protein
MSKVLYGVKIKKRPHISQKIAIDLSGQQGKQIILSETKLALLAHQKTFKRLADM